MSSLFNPAQTAIICAAAMLMSVPSASASNEKRPDFSGAWTRGGVMGVPGPGIPTVNNGEGICVINCAPRRPAPADGEAASAPRPRPRLNFPNYKEEYRNEVARLREEQVLHDTSLRCRNPGLPRIGPPNTITQTESELIIL